jgi:hypothetical protein
MGGCVGIKTSLVCGMGLPWFLKGFIVGGYPWLLKGFIESCYPWLLKGI